MRFVFQLNFFFLTVYFFSFSLPCGEKRKKDESKTLAKKSKSIHYILICNYTILFFIFKIK